jgi:hypothetical protein
MNKLLLLSILLFPGTLIAQERKLKARQPNVIELTHFDIRLHPNDTMFNNVKFDHLPVKGFPFFTADPRKDFYTIEQRDSVLRRIDEMFFE